MKEGDTMNYTFITISLCFVIFTYFGAKWAFRYLAIFLLLKLITLLKEKGLEAFKQKAGGFTDADNAEM